jgi:hypothetical protein
LIPDLAKDACDKVVRKLQKRTKEKILRKDVYQLTLLNATEGDKTLLPSRTRQPHPKEQPEGIPVST